jgi:hypothetical protein
MNEVVRDVDSPTRTAQRLGLKHVAFVKIEAAPLERGRAAPVTHEAADIPTFLRHRGAEQSTDETSSARDKCPAGHVVTSSTASRITLPRQAPEHDRARGAAYGDDS